MEIPDEYTFIDYGLDLYAPQTTVDAEGRRVMEAWLRMPEVTEEGWIGMFCSPRVVERRGSHIYFRMHPIYPGRLFKRDIPGAAFFPDDGYMAVFDLEDG